MSEEKILENYTRPNWPEIFKDISSMNEDECNDFASSECLKWLQNLQQNLSDDYQFHESDNFILMTTGSDRSSKVILNYSELSIKRILESLEGIVQDVGYGKHVILMLKDADTYYAYYDKAFDGEGEFGFSSGVYFNNGYGHFVFYEEEFDHMEPIIVHELTHALLAHLPIPLWLNEGIAVCSEKLHSRGGGLHLSKELVTEHQDYWNEDNIQSYWTGRSFSFTDRGQRLSYHLAEWMVSTLSNDYEAFKYFVNNADWEDAGDKALMNEYGRSLSEVIEIFFEVSGYGPKLENMQQHKQEELLEE